jgi:hypothetical protein
MCAPRYAPEVAPVLAPGPASAVAPPQEPLHARLRHALANEPQKACRGRSTAPAYAARQPSSRMEVRRIYPTSKPSAQDHAQRLLEWLQDDPSLVGHLVPASEIEWTYFFLSDELKWKHLPWQSVAALVQAPDRRRKSLSARRRSKRARASHSCTCERGLRARAHTVAV